MPITTKREWLQGPYAKAVQRAPERQPSFETTGRMPIEPIYTQDDLEGWDPVTQLGFPGEFPFTRGIQPTMYRGRLWTMRQYAGFGTAEESNQRYRYLLSQGQTGLSVAFDLPTQIGYDSDDPMAAGEVGKVGVAIDSIEDMLVLFDGIPLDKVTTSMTINATAAILLALYVAVGKHQGVSPDRLGGTVQNDILKEYIARGTYIYPPKPSMRLITDIFAYCKDNVPQWNTISISGYHMREAGCTAAQEIAFTLANGIAYVEAALGAGLDVDEFAGRLSFFFACHNNFLEEVAKFRAARRLWAHIMRDRFEAKNPRSQMLRFHTQTGGATLTAQQPENNIVRTTVQALAAVLGGTQSLHTNSMDEALALPTEKAVQIALRTQQILAYESGVADVIDPLGGSYFVEDLTNRLEAEAREYIKTIDSMGGALAAIEKGFQQKEIQEAAYRYQMQVENKERIIVGVNEFIVAEEEQPEILRVDPAIGQRQVEKLRRLRATRDNAAVERMLDRIEQAARGTENLVPIMIEAVENRVTLGEISHRLRKVWGEQREPVFI
ncbi:acyl-CoA mutase large subunit family protein [Tepidiforma thermophila]|uniref:methylmalonyl-CoA mutase n=1 Tax=Tepidiforma thermophila (strain KCTC 52669 / CGMCC 1.13589 / G233) TaxID=2761530 RepID=A0A2A9HIR2_TEPT2|nr:methylmalonyl-CoA mutase family protein [Tepidiforma thermophila]PFG74925.1 methylmalonyl-CoA mutase [Tepidiforma thermophila]